MKICLFEHHNNPYPVIGYGGVERVNQNLYKSLLDLGHDVTLLIVEGTTLDYKHGKVISLPYENIEKKQMGSYSFG